MEQLLAGVDPKLGAHEGGVVVGATRGRHFRHGGCLRLPTAGKHIVRDGLDHFAIRFSICK